MVVKIIGVKKCPKCDQAKIKYPDAEYILLQDAAMCDVEKITLAGLTSAPVLFDENGEIING